MSHTLLTLPEPADPQLTVCWAEQAMGTAPLRGSGCPAAPSILFLLLPPWQHGGPAHLAALLRARPTRNVIL